MELDCGLRTELSDDLWFRLLDDVERELVAEMADGPPMRVLEIAPRLGGVATLLSDRHEAWALHDGTTPLSPALTTCPIEYPYPLEDESIDLVLLLGRIEEDDAPARTLGEIRRVLREGGRALIAVANPAAVPGASTPYPEILAESALPGLLARHDLLIDRLHAWGPQGSKPIAWIGSALRALRSSASEHNRIGVVLFQQGRPGQAWTHFERAIELEPDLADAHFNRAAIHRLAGREDLYREGLDATLRAAPDHPGALEEMRKLTRGKDEQSSIPSESEALEIGS
ncbi:MAG: hypothetical protein CME06_16240 [Gemmatimonadetes bacterium]|nr:hypothetical protein [Gemmatimonadota bacterium]